MGNPFTLAYWSRTLKSQLKLCAHVGEIKIRSRQVDNTLLLCKQEAKQPIGREHNMAKARSWRCWMLLCARWNEIDKSTRCLVKLISSGNLSSEMFYELWTALYALLQLRSSKLNSVLQLYPCGSVHSFLQSFIICQMVSIFLHTSLSSNLIAFYKNAVQNATCMK
jgi:hypothetical protein